MVHTMNYRVPYADTDQMGVVYYANYLEYFERSRTEMLRDAGLSYAKMEATGFYLPVSEVHCKYTGSAHYDDLLTFASWIEELGRVRITIRTDVMRQDKVLVSGTVILGCVNREFRISRLSPLLIECCERCFPTVYDNKEK